MTRTLIAAFLLTGCMAADGENDMFLIDCAYQTTPIGWDEALPDGTTPRERLDGLPGGHALGEDGTSFDGSLSVSADAASPAVDRASGVEGELCAPQLRLPVTVQLVEDAVVLADALGEAMTHPDTPSPITFDAAIPDHARFGLDAALEPGEAADGVFLHLDGAGGATHGRVHALVSGDDAEVAWQRDVTLIALSVAP